MAIWCVPAMIDFSSHSPHHDGVALIFTLSVPESGRPMCSMSWLLYQILLGFKEKGTVEWLKFIII